jgi:hypothetical protein
MSQNIQLSRIRPVGATTITQVAGVLTYDCEGQYITTRLKLLDNSSKLNFTLSITNAVAGCRGTLIIKQSVAGTCTITLPTSSVGKLITGTPKTLTIYGEANENHYINFEFIDSAFQFRFNLYNVR